MHLFCKCQLRFLNDPEADDSTPGADRKAADPSQVSGLSVCAYSAAFSCALWYCRVYSW